MSDFNQISGFYDQETLKAMSQMWNMDQYANYSPKEDKVIPNMTPFTHPFAFAQHLNSITNMQLRETPPPTKRKANPVPPEQKDDAYFERRKKNNDSARRSREQRRMKEERNAAGMELFQQENLRLKQEVHRLTMELHQLRQLVNQNPGFVWPANPGQ